MGGGSFDTVTPDEAREWVRECRQQVLKGIDPLEHKKAALLDRKLAKAKDKTFREVAEEWRAHKIKSGEWAPARLKESEGIFEKYIYRRLGDLPVQKFDMRRFG